MIFSRPSPFTVDRFFFLGAGAFARPPPSQCGSVGAFVFNRHELIISADFEKGSMSAPPQGPVNGDAVSSGKATKSDQRSQAHFWYAVQLATCQPGTEDGTDAFKPSGRNAHARAASFVNSENAC
jgi:hypothetical protein